VKEDKMVRSFGMQISPYTRRQYENLKKRGNLEDLVVRGIKVFGFILKKRGVDMD
jgi:hypothetical protein